MESFRPCRSVFATAALNKKSNAERAKSLARAVSETPSTSPLALAACLNHRKEAHAYSTANSDSSNAGRAKSLARAVSVARITSPLAQTACVKHYKEATPAYKLSSSALLIS